jgi:hypothetical protein
MSIDESNAAVNFVLQICLERVPRCHEVGRISASTHLEYYYGPSALPLVPVAADELLPVDLHAGVREMEDVVHPIGIYTLPTLTEGYFTLLYQVMIGRLAMQILSTDEIRPGQRCWVVSDEHSKEPTRNKYTHWHPGGILLTTCSN